ncbi:MAG: hypothetical protein AAGA58_14245 [Verrucomicrobiota bacterium]
MDNDRLNIPYPAELRPRAILIRTAIFLSIVTVILLLVLKSVPLLIPDRTRPYSIYLQNGVNIQKALVNYALSNEGIYPQGDNANEALGFLVDDLTSEKPFYISNSPWHGKKFGRGPDNRWETTDPPGIALEAGENVWSYTLGLNFKSPAEIPILATIWRRKLCLVVYADGHTDTFEISKDTIRPSELFPEVNMVDPLPPPNGLPE